jgi:hypothetical protein
MTESVNFTNFTIGTDEQRARPARRRPDHWRTAMTQMAQSFTQEADAILERAVRADAPVAGQGLGKVVT